MDGKLEGHKRAVTSLCLDDEFLYSGSWDQTIIQWRLKTNSIENILEGNTILILYVE
jgi:hypothetical protein